MKTKDPAWDRWFDVTYDLSREIQARIDEVAADYSPSFKAAMISGIIEDLIEAQRMSIELPLADREPGGYAKQLKIRDQDQAAMDDHA